MFSDSHMIGINIPSIWKSERITKESESQTHQIVNAEIGIQSSSTKSCETQTSENIDSHKTRPLKTFDSQQLLKFVTKASKITIEELEKSKTNQIIDIISKSQDDNKANVLEVETFSSEYLKLLEKDSDLKYIVSSLSWNSNALILGIAYKVNDHIDWCTHESYALLWNIFKNSNKPQEPAVVLEIDSCITVFKAHPKQPYIYSAATNNGKVCVWNTRNSETEMLFASVMAHQSCVTALNWIPSNRKADLGLLISCGLDGNIFSFKVQENNKLLSIESAFTILAQDMPRSIPIKGDKIGSEVGIVSMSFNPEDSSVFIVGCNGGAIFQCYLNSTKPAIRQSYSLMSTNNKTIEFKSPVIVSYAAHRGNIYAVKFSPMLTNIFFSCSVDNELRVYNILQNIPLMVIHTQVPIVSADWSPSRPNIAAVGEDGNVYIYSIKNKRVSKPLFTFSIGENIFAKNLIYNQMENNEQIAISASNGDIRVWDLSSLTQPIDRKHINNIFKRITDEEK